MRDIKKIFNRIESIVLALSVIGVFFLIMQLGFIKDMEMPAFYDDYAYNFESESIKRRQVGYIVFEKNGKEIEEFFIKVKGKGKYNFNENDELILKVINGDVIELDNTLCNDKAILKVVGVSKNVEEPNLNDIFTINEGIKTLLKVKLK
ncbi:hypothetical protein DW1_1787 [Proteiniborus sp. DW1]|uniref:hypothetical protein n=1 Tax=Proteiniborus sp. DW1 TaxID=1889883 RepID=UPI00092DFACD|nr:hypothetical protein [Proteiniborus sp. DW1]SCG83357.1 hypothetical protein DW1_1787 [Proteiniborus sp. DW1]